MTHNTTKIVTLLAVLIVSATMSGCIETREISEPSMKSASDSIYNSGHVQEYLETHDLSAGFGDLQITLHPDKTVTSGNQTGKWFSIGSAENVWRCSIQGIDGIEYLYLHDGRIAETWDIENQQLNGIWFR